MEPQNDFGGPFPSGSLVTISARDDDVIFFPEEMPSMILECLPPLNWTGPPSPTMRKSTQDRVEVEGLNGLLRKKEFGESFFRAEVLVEQPGRYRDRSNGNGQRSRDALVRTRGI